VGIYHCIQCINCSAKQVITDRRNRLNTDSVECVECLHYWLGSGMVAVVPIDGNPDESIIVDK
jgi:hypothetical protein